MTWLLDLVEEHRAAVRYDLLKHGYRLEWLATARLPWSDALAIISMQPPATSAVYRVTHPDEFDRDKKLDRLETIAVLLVRGQMLQGNRSGVKPDDLPLSWADLIDQVEEAPMVEVALLSFAEIDERMGWGEHGRS